MGEWISTLKQMPEDEKVVLIHEKGLAEHGVISAWWCMEDKYWVALDDEVHIDYDRVDFWRPMIELPDYGS